MQVSNTNSFIFSQAQIDTLNGVEVDLHTQKTADEVISAYEKYLNHQREQSRYAIAIIVSNVAMIIFTVLDCRALVLVSVAYICVFSYIYYENKKTISSNIDLVKKLGASYSELSKISARDGVALAIDAHVRKKIYLAIDHVNKFRLQNAGTNYFEINQILSN